MKNSLLISASVDRPELLESMVKQLAVRHSDIGYGKARVPKAWKALESSTIESYVSGNLQLTLPGNEIIKMPFISCFLFTCTKEKREPYKLNWSISLS